MMYSKGIYLLTLLHEHIISLKHAAFIMKKQIIIFFILIVSLNLSAQTNYYPIDLTGYRLLNLTNSIYDNGFLMAGTKANQYDNESHGYGILKKLDINGNPLWEKLIGIVPPPAWTNIRYVSQTNDGGYIISGAVNRVGSDFYFDMFVIKTNYCGELQWQKIFSSPSLQNVHEIYELEDGSFLVQLDLWEYENDPNKRLWVFKLDQNGNTLWKKYFADYDPWPGSSEMVWQFLPDKIGNYAMTGYYYHRNPEGDSTVVWLRPFVLKIDTAGNEIWHNILGVQDYFYGANFSACANSLGSIYSAGQKRLPSEAFINKVDYTGQTIYKNVLPLDALRSSAIGITSLNDSTFYTVVYTVDSIDQVNDVASYHLLQLDSNAVIMDSVIMLDSTVLNSCPMLITKDNKILIGSYELNFGPDNWTGKLWKYNTNLEIDSVYTQNFLYDTLCP